MDMGGFARTSFITIPELIPTGPTSPGSPGAFATDPAGNVYFYKNGWWKVPGSNAFGAVTLSYASDGDANGVFNYMGVVAGGGTWTNPRTAGALTIVASGVIGSVVGIEGLVDRISNDVFINPAADNNFTFYLGSTRRLQCTKWSYQDRNTGATYPVAIDLYASLDGITYVLLDSRTGLTGGNATWHSFSIAPGAFYSYFKLIKRGLANDGQNHFCLGEVELYGVLSF